MNVRILNGQGVRDTLVSWIVPVEDASRVLAVFSADCVEHSVDAAWDWADANGHVVVED